MYIKHITPVLKKITAIIWVERIFMAHKTNPNTSGVCYLFRHSTTAYTIDVYRLDSNVFVTY